MPQGSHKDQFDKAIDEKHPALAETEESFKTLFEKVNMITY